MRFQGSVEVRHHLDAARHPRRVSTGTFCAPKIVRTGLDQHQRDAPGGEQRLERAAVQPADDRAFEHGADERRR